MRRCSLFAFIIFVALSLAGTGDLANPVLPGTFEFENEDESPAFVVESTPWRPERSVAPSDDPYTADRQLRKTESAPRMVRAGRVTSDWLAIRQAHAPAPPPPPASEDH
jgi:hypothetical protein